MTASLVAFLGWGHDAAHQSSTSLGKTEPREASTRNADSTSDAQGTSPSADEGRRDPAGDSRQPLSALPPSRESTGSEESVGDLGEESTGTRQSPPGSDEEAAAADEPSPDPEEIRERRYMRSDSIAERVLKAPESILDLPWYPIKLFLNFSERVDLYERAQDFFFFNEERTAGWAPEVSLGGELEDAFGASIYHHDLFDREHSADATFLFASGEEYSWRAAYAVPGIDYTPLSLRFDIDMLRDEEVEIFVTPDAQGKPVLGMDTDEDDETDYEFRTFHTRLELGWEVLSGFRVAPHIRGEISKAKPSGPAVTALLTGLDGLDEEIGLIASGFTVTLDRRDNPLRPSSGWFLQSAVEASIAPDKTNDGNRFGHTDYSLEASLFLPLHGPHRVLVLRQSLQRVDPWGGNDLAFYHQPILDLVHGLRSFERYRFRDRGVLLTNIEYRYPIWRTWDAYVFGDGGQTFHHYSDIDTDDFEFSVGGGIRFMTEDRFLLLLQVGYGSEGTETYFSVGQVF